MNHTQILKRAWKILWSYRTLWIFGIILALTTSSGGGNGGGGNNRIQFRGRTEEFGFTPPPEIQRLLSDLNRFLTQGIPRDMWNTLIAIGIVLICLVILISIVFTIGRYVSEVALIRMVDRYEDSEEKVGWREGFRLGWSRSAWRLFLIDLLIGVPVFLVIMVLFGCASLPVLLSWLVTGEPSVLGIITTIGLVFLVVFVAIVIWALLSLIMEIIYRQCVLQSSGVIDSIRQGWQTVRRNLKDIFLMWLILLGIQIGFVILMIPVIIALLAGGGIAGAGVGLAVYALLQALAGISSGWIAAIVLGFLVFLIILSLPLLFLKGLLMTYLSTVWTLTYRQTRQLAITDTIPTEPGVETA